MIYLLWKVYSKVPSKEMGHLTHLFPSEEMGQMTLLPQCLIGYTLRKER